MGSMQIIEAAVAAIDLLNKSIERANAGDLTTAKQHLDKAREHFSASVAKWDAAGT